jgi:hypothetical protein
MFQLLQETQPLFLPAGELTCTAVPSGNILLPGTIFLPEVCNLPLGMRWPIDIGYADFKSSIQGALGAAGQLFQKMLQGMDTLLEKWFVAVAQDPANFTIPSCSFLSFYDTSYPAIDTGDWPETVLDAEGFSPLLDMMNGYLWRIWCDRMLTTASKMNCQYLNTYLLIGDAVTKQDTYLGANIPGRFCPNFAYHFKVTNGWPTDTPTSVFLKEFLHLPLISYQARQYDPVEVDLHQPQLQMDIFKTWEEKRSENHKAMTPRTTTIPPPMTPPDPKMSELRAKRLGLSTKDKPLEIPSTVKKYTPDFHSKSCPPSRGQMPTQRRLEDELNAGSTPMSTAVGQDILSVAKFTPMTGTIYTTEGRAAASDAFLNVCRLLAHHSTRHPMMVGRDQLPLEALIFVREPCGLFRREILVHFQKVTSTGGFMPSFLSFIEAMLRPAQIQLSGVYDPNFFSGAFLHAFFLVKSWMVSDHMLPANVPLATFHGYCLISCLQ